MRQLTKQELELISGGTNSEQGSDYSEYGFYMDWSSFDESQAYSNFYFTDNFNGGDTDDYSYWWNPDPDNMYYSGMDQDGNLHYNFNDTFQTADGQTQIDEVIVTASAENGDTAVVFVGLDGNIAAGLGITGGAGGYAELRSDGVTFGVYDTEGMSLGSGASGAVVVGYSDSLEAFQGATVNVSLADGTMQVTAGANPSGMTYSAGVGVTLGVTASSTDTHVNPIVDLSVQQQRGVDHGAPPVAWQQLLAA